MKEILKKLSEFRRIVGDTKIQYFYNPNAYPSFGLGLGLGRVSHIIRIFS